MTAASAIRGSEERVLDQILTFGVLYETNQHILHPKLQRADAYVRAVTPALRIVRRSVGLVGLSASENPSILR